MGREVLKRNYENEGNLISKECSCCHQIKSVLEFHKCKKNNDGLQLKCKECLRKYNRENKGKIKEKKKVSKRNYDNEGNLISKECSCCHEVKPASEFSKCKSKADGLQFKCKECLRKYNQKNRDKINERMRKYKQENKDKIKERNRKYNQKNRDKINERNRKYRQENKDKISERMRKYSQENRDKTNERVRKNRAKKTQETLQQIKIEVESNPDKYNHIEGKEVYGIIYLVYNIKSDKYYVGQTTIGFDNRYPLGWLYEHSKKDTVKHDLELYGENSFEYTKLFKIAYSQYELDKLEAYYINYYNSYENGYNETRGNIFTDRGKEK